MDKYIKEIMSVFIVLFTIKAILLVVNIISGDTENLLNDLSSLSLMLLIIILYKKNGTLE